MIQKFNEDRKFKWWEKLVIVMITILVLLIIFLIFNEEILGYINDFKQWYQKS